MRKTFFLILFLFLAFSFFSSPQTVFADKPSRVPWATEPAGTKGETSLILSWGQVTNTNWYLVKYGTDVNNPDQTVPIASGSSECNQPTPQTCRLTLSSLSPGTQYHFQFIACNNDGCANAYSYRTSTKSLSVPTSTPTFTPTSTSINIPSGTPPPSQGLLQGIGEIIKCNPVNNTGCSGTVAFPQAQNKITSLGSFITNLFDVVFVLAAFLTFIWLAWGAFEYIFSGGNKEGLSKARSRIIWAIVGLIFLALSFALAQFVEQILDPKQDSPISLVTTAYAASPTPIGENLENVYDFGNVGSLGEGINKLVVPAFSIATTAVVIYFLVGGFIWLTSGGDKEGIGKAREMITHAVIGFLLLMFIFLILQFIPEFFGFKFSIFQ